MNNASVVAASLLLGAVVLTIVAGCTSLIGNTNGSGSAAPRVPTVQDVTASMKSSFKPAGSALLDRLDQSELQAACSEYAGKELPKALKEKLEKAALDAVKYPADAKYTGDWRAGERIAQSGVGMQFSDAPNTVGGGNCYACHQLTKAELAYGNIGPSLYNYGKLRGNAEATMKYTWARLWNPHAFNACNNMPRFGAAGILNDAQLKDLMALLLDPESPVNK